MRKLATGESFGWINVVAYGYHAFEVPYQQHDVYQAGMTPGAFTNAYTGAMRALEIDMLQGVLNGLSAGASPRWMITLINKQDLWWHERAAVRRHYEGEYNDKVDRIQRALGSAHFQHEMLPVAFTMANFNSDGTALASTNAGDDLPAHLSYLETMYRTIDELLREGRKR